ncbi:hypothetical protein HW115_11665 [Verrucomicrobiaceae bacterium N1E253]|uniref:Uncharacterized protein n=1 Tax=Oceaniferula marina TaxID=2748318 RepID=A0A851GN57_9BACT|nr:Amuc_1100 family pilus-like protein [Oceaniferula marina]NWK56270.1 hypothetical protein [Oceaniferula marina]
MSWIQENTFVAGLVGVTAVVGGAFLFFGFSQGGAYNEKLEQFEELKSQYAQLEKQKPYPTSGHLAAREEGVEAYDEMIDEVRSKVLKFAPAKLEKMTPDQFRDVRVQMGEELRAAFTKAGTELPDGCLFGFENYEVDSARMNATAKLNYELEAIKWLLNQLAEVKPVSLNNIRRVELPEESGVVVQPEPVKGKGKKARRPKPGQSSGEAFGRVYEMMPVELSFTANEDAVRSFISEMVNSEKYYFAIRGARFRNERQTPPTHQDANFPADIIPAAGGADGGFAGFEGFIDDGESALGEEDSTEVAEDGAEDPVVQPAKPVVPAGELILKQVLGSENIQVHLCFDVILLTKKEEAESSKGKGKKATEDSSDDSSDS